MKKIFYSLIVISLLFVSCDKDNQNDNLEENVIVGGVYLDYTGVVINPCNIKVMVRDEIYTFNHSEAIYSSHQPTTNQNVFMIFLSDTTSHNGIRFDIFTPVISPEDFFAKSTIQTDTIRIDWQGTTEDFYDAEALLKWDTASFADHNFKGKVSLEITKKIVGIINSDTYYPKQKIEFEFN